MTDQETIDAMIAAAGKAAGAFIDGPRLATLDDVDDDCPFCHALAKKIESGNAPTVLGFENGILELPNYDDSEPTSTEVDR